MQDNIFIDSNVILYAFSKNKRKKERAKNIIKNRGNISIQVLNEVSNTLFKKSKLEPTVVKKSIDLLIKYFQVYEVKIYTIYRALDLKERYKFSYYDSLIIASAIENGCDILYSEDMQHKQVIDDKLTIINPFVWNMGLFAI